MSDQGKFRKGREQEAIRVNTQPQSNKIYSVSVTSLVWKSETSLDNKGHFKEVQTLWYIEPTRGLSRAKDLT